jgi:exonuclease SbcC
MRPISLDMQGFASFRDQTRVDFTDAEFFALVGPTGSGKSTVIDAMTFALYGSVPRWGRKGMVSLALAPSVARGTVKLVFEVDGQRYVVARELRRVGAQVTQRAASVERLLDPRGTAQPGEPTAPLAKDLAGVNDAVERLIGLSYEDFIQCVVLPQGQFAAFLHAKPGDRQEILLRLLGAEHYKQMMMMSNQRASAAGQRADIIAETLRGYADATPEAEDRARAAETALAQLGEQVAEALPKISQAEAELAATESRLERTRAEHAALSALRVPPDVAALDADLTAGWADLERLRDAEKAAEYADTTARDALQRGPQRAPLELARERRAERSRHQGAIPGLRAAAERLSAQAESTATAVDTAEKALEGLRARRDEAARGAETARERVERLAAEHLRLAQVTIPDGVAALDERLAAAAAAVAGTARALAEAEQADSAARAARGTALPEAPLAQASRDIGELRELRTDLTTAGLGARQAYSARATAETALAAAEEALRAGRGAVEETRRAHVIAGLRPHLTAGEACPLCEQTVTTLPAPLAAREMDDAQARLEESERAVAAAQSAMRKAAAAAERAAAGLESRLTRRASLLAALAAALRGPLAAAPLPALTALAATATSPDPGAEAAPDDDLIAHALGEADALIRARAELEQAAQRAAAAADAARTRQRSAQAAERKAEDDQTTARTQLRRARDPLVELGAPQADDANLAEGWARLSEWAAGQARVRTAALAEARQAAQQADGQHQRATAEFRAAEQALTRLRGDAKTAATQDQQAKARLTQVTGRVAELDELLRDAPGEDEVAAQLALRDQLEAAAAKAGQALRAARTARASGQTALAGLERADKDAQALLSAARDRVVALGAPALDGRGLLDGWTELVTWASVQARVRDEEIRAASAAAGAAWAGVRQLTGRLGADLANAGIDLAPHALATGAASAVAGSLERARAATRRVAERRGEAAELDGRQRAAVEEQRVARLLADLLRANNFQRWLVSEAVDDLVTAASQMLAALSSGQFDLTHEDGEFFVIDHTDAEARRSVRTLSGGETFQASLALALALSSQISALAAAGAARLDSIFLDEGFGTLDSETLEVVATTLETLAQGQRMVGIVTHVTALADRVPVRFRVARDARTSSVTREGLTAETDVL